MSKIATENWKEGVRGMKRQGGNLNLNGCCINLWYRKAGKDFKKMILSNILFVGSFKFALHYIKTKSPIDRLVVKIKKKKMHNVSKKQKRFISFKLL